MFIVFGVYESRALLQMLKCNDVVLPRYKSNSILSILYGESIDEYQIYKKAEPVIVSATAPVTLPIEPPNSSYNSKGEYMGMPQNTYNNQPNSNIDMKGGAPKQQKKPDNQSKQTENNNIQNNNVHYVIDPRKYI